MPEPKLKPIPKFATEAAEQKFWVTGRIRRQYC